MNKKLNALVVGMIGLLAFASMALAQGYSKWGNSYPESAVPGIMVKYVGSGSATVIVTATTASFNEGGGGAQSTTLTATVTADQVVAKGNGATNVSGVKNFKCMTWGLLGGDFPTNKWFPSTNTMVANTWTPIGYLIPSNTMQYNVILNPTTPVGDQPMGGFRVTSLYGDAPGSTNGSVKIYDGGSLVYQKGLLCRSVTDPGTNEVRFGEINLGSGVYIGQGHVGIARVTWDVGVTNWIMTSGGGGVGANMAWGAQP